MYVFDGDGVRNQRSLVKSQASNPYNIIYYTHTTTTTRHTCSTAMIPSLTYYTLNTDELGISSVTENNIILSYVE